MRQEVESTVTVTRGTASLKQQVVHTGCRGRLGLGSYGTQMWSIPSSKARGDLPVQEVMKEEKEGWSSFNGKTRNVWPAEGQQ